MKMGLEKIGWECVDCEHVNEPMVLVKGEEYLV
jgi:hypothetical protein